MVFICSRFCLIRILRRFPRGSVFRAIHAGTPVPREFRGSAAVPRTPPPFLRGWRDAWNERSGSVKRRINRRPVAAADWRSEVRRRETTPDRPFPGRTFDVAAVTHTAAWELLYFHGQAGGCYPTFSGWYRSCRFQFEPTKPATIIFVDATQSPKPATQSLD